MERSKLEAAFYILAVALIDRQVAVRVGAWYRREEMHEREAERVSVVLRCGGKPFPDPDAS